jgi:hypothetical protein
VFAKVRGCGAIACPRPVGGRRRTCSRATRRGASPRTSPSCRSCMSTLLIYLGGVSGSGWLTPKRNFRHALVLKVTPSHLPRMTSSRRRDTATSGPVATLPFDLEPTTGGFTNFGAHNAHYHVSPNGLISTLKDHAERGWHATCHASSAIAAGAMKNSSGLSLNLSRAHCTSITARSADVFSATHRGPWYRAGASAAARRREHVVASSMNRPTDDGSGRMA